MKKTIRLQQHEEIESLKQKIYHMQNKIDALEMMRVLSCKCNIPIDQELISAYRLGIEYNEAKHSGKLYEQNKNTN